MVAATTTSGQPVPVPNTPRAGSSTARLPSTEAALATSAPSPTAPHSEGVGQRSVPCMSRRDAQYPQAEDAHGCAFRESRHGALMQRHANYEEANGHSSPRRREGRVHRQAEGIRQNLGQICQQFSSKWMMPKHR